MAMSNENKDWRLNRILDVLPNMEGWEYKASEHHIDDDRFVKGELSLTVSQMFEIVEAGYNEGYNTALEHIRGICNKELGDY